MSEDERRAYRITGRVQGVGFRWWTCRLARHLGLRGQVRNLRDGSVEVRARGPETVLVSFEERLKQGPPGARVARLQRFDPGAIEVDDFHIGFDDEP